MIVELLGILLLDLELGHSLKKKNEEEITFKFVDFLLFFILANFGGENLLKMNLTQQTLFQISIRGSVAGRLAFFLIIMGAGDMDTKDSQNAVSGPFI